MGFYISNIFADQIRTHENKHVAIARGLLRVFSDAESEMKNLNAVGLSLADCFNRLDVRAQKIDRKTKLKYLRLEARISEKLDSVEQVSFERRGILWLSRLPILTGNFDVEAEISQELSR